MFSVKYFSQKHYPCKYFPPCLSAEPPPVTAGIGQEYSLPENLIHYSMPESPFDFSSPENELQYSLPENLIHFGQYGKITYTFDEDS